MRVHHCISGNVLSVPLPLAPGHIHSPSRPWNEWDDAATPRTDRPVTLSRTGPTPASQWGICRVIRAARASFPFGPQS